MEMLLRNGTKNLSQKRFIKTCQTVDKIPTINIFLIYIFIYLYNHFHLIKLHHKLFVQQDSVFPFSYGQVFQSFQNKQASF